MSLSLTGTTRRGSWFSFMNGSADDKNVKPYKRGSISHMSGIDQKPIPFFSKRRSFVVRDVRHVGGKSVPINDVLYDSLPFSPTRRETKEKEQQQQQQQRVYGKCNSEVLSDYIAQNEVGQYSTSSNSTIASSAGLSVPTPPLSMTAQYNCKICTNFEAIPNEMLVCGHVFHDNCIRGWAGQCPTCTIY